MERQGRAENKNFGGDLWSLAKKYPVKVTALVAEILLSTALLANFVIETDRSLKGRSAELLECKVERDRLEGFFDKCSGAFDQIAEGSKELAAKCTGEIRSQRDLIRELLADITEQDVINHSLRDVIVDLKAEVDDCLDAKPIE